MSSLASLRRKVHYETNVPRCGSCAHVRRLDNLLRDSLPQPLKWLCARNSFEVKANAVCDRWMDRVTGDTVEKCA